jgi:glycerol-3-phosphate O-acyltransferase / dihydroxyacetone phosphate acyltransferase
MKWKNRKKSNSYVYLFLEAMTHLAYRLFFKKMYINTLTRLPDDKPVLVASNHPTAFIECAVVTACVDTPVFNMARGDVFRKPFFRKLMESINMFPVYRKRDGYDESGRNDEVFNYCVEKLRINNTVAIYVEGEHHSDKRVRPAQKGIARLAFAAYEKHQLEELAIYPMGNNYAREGTARDEYMVNFGQPIFVRDYANLYAENPGRAVTQLCRDIEIALQAVCFHLEHPEDDALAEQLLTLHRSENAPLALPIISYENERLDKEKRVLDRLNALSASDKNTLREKSAQYFEALQQAGLSDAAFINARRWSHWAWLLFFIGLFPFFFVGYITIGPLLWLSHWVANKTVKKKIFHGSVVLGVQLLGGIIWYFLWLLATLLSFRWYCVLGFVALFPLGWFSVTYLEQWKRFRDGSRAVHSPSTQSLAALRQSVRAVFP